ncbi:MAG: beta propeller repeat protein [Acidimicrobiales bacterium]
MRRWVDLRELDPVDVTALAAAGVASALDDLRHRIVSAPPLAALDDSPATNQVPPELGRPRRPARQVAAIAAAIVLLGAGLSVGLSVGLATTGLGGSQVVTTGWQPGRAFPGVAPDVHRHGRWRLVDDVLSGTWHQDSSGPPPGSLSCPTSRDCYVMSGRYPNAHAGAPLLSVSLYASSDTGASWSVLALPSGFAPTGPLSCGGATDCAAGGTYRGRPVLLTTTDSGHTVTLHPLPAGVGRLADLSCPTATFCGGLASATALPGVPTRLPRDATFLSTGDGGASFSDRPILPGGSMEALDCSSPTDCTAIGISDTANPAAASGVVARTTDGGADWTAGSIPAGVGVSDLSALSCADAEHCSMIGSISIALPNPPECASLPGGVRTARPAGVPPAPVSPAVQAVAEAESRLAQRVQAAALAGAGHNSGVSFSCSPDGTTTVADVLSTTDGGLHWTPELLPGDVPQPMLNGLSCPTDSECWATGSDAVPEHVDGADNGGSPVLLGTTDGGANWSPVSFTTPAGAPNYDGQSFLSIGSISCPTALACAAQGAAAQGSPTAPVYRLSIPPPG